jgi:hypothetical protein
MPRTANAYIILNKVKTVNDPINNSRGVITATAQAKNEAN